MFMSFDTMCARVSLLPWVAPMESNCRLCCFYELEEGSTTWIIMMFPRTKISLQQLIPPCARNFWGRSVAFLDWLSLNETCFAHLPLCYTSKTEPTTASQSKLATMLLSNNNSMSIKACNHVVQQQHYMNFTIFPWKITCRSWNHIFLGQNLVKIHQLKKPTWSPVQITAHYVG
jgi:hypothetical protein